MGSMEDYFKRFRENVVGHQQPFNSIYGKNRIIYADWTASGRLYRPIEEKMLERFGPFIGNTHSESNETGSTMTKAYLYAKEQIKRHVNAGPDDVIITHGYGMTSVINKFQRILGIKVYDRIKDYVKLPEELRPVVFITHMEHHSNHTSWLETLSDVVVIEPDAQGLVDLDHLESEVRKYSGRRFKIGSFTACSNITGIHTPYHKMAAIMHRYDGICLVDFATSAPYVKIDMHPSDPMEKLDAIFFSPHKFLGGPGTSGVMIFDKSLYDNNAPDVPGGGTVNWTTPWGGRSYISDIETREDGGTPGFLQAIRTALCIQLKEDMGEENLQRREQEILNLAFSQLQDVQGIHILAGNVRDRQGIISFCVDHIHYNLMVRILNDRFGIQVRGGCSCAGTYGHYLLDISREVSDKIVNLIEQGDFSLKPGWTRLSLHPIMTDDEITYITDSIKKTVANISIWKEDYDYDKLRNEFKYKDIHEGDNRIDQWFLL